MNIKIKITHIIIDRLIIITYNCIIRSDIMDLINVREISREYFGVKRANRFTQVDVINILGISLYRLQQFERGNNENLTLDELNMIIKFIDNYKYTPI